MMPENSLSAPIDKIKYNPDFFANQSTNLAQYSAKRVLKEVMRIVNPQSVVDIGCGVGAWLNELSNYGITDILGIDGEYVDRTQLLIAQESFLAADLTRLTSLSKQYDLAICLEVAEHLPKEASKQFVKFLTCSGRFILFSAAIPGQGGVNHVNEQWQDWWAGLFEEFGYRPIDCIRPSVWSDPSVAYCYSQNAFLYATPESLKTATSGVDFQLRFPLRVVHPIQFTQLQQIHDPKNMSFRSSARVLLRVMSRAIARRVLRRKGI